MFELVTQNVTYFCETRFSLFSHFTKIYSLEILFKHVMIIRKIGIVNVQLEKDNIANRKYYYLKLSTCKLLILNFQLVKTNWKLVK